MDAVQHAQRRQGLGGSDAAVVLGLSAYRDRLALWLEKTGRVPRDATETKATRRGNRLEAAVLDEYAEVQGAVLLRGEGLAAAGPFVHPQHEWMRASPDALVLEAHAFEVAPLARVRGGVDAKTAAGAAAYAWGREGTDEIPVGYLCQGLHYCAVFGVPWWDFAVLVGGDRFQFQFYRVRADADLLAHLIEQERQFWLDHVVADVAPTEGANPESRIRWARVQHPVDELPMLVADSEDVLARIGALAVAKRACETADASYEAAKADVVELIGQHQGIETSLGTVTYRATRAGTRVFKTEFKPELLSP